MDLFFFGTLRDAGLLELVLGRAEVGQVAVLPGWHAERVRGADYPMLVAGGSAAGILVVDLSTEDLARLRHYESGFGYDIKELQVEVNGEKQPAQVFFTSDSVPSGAPYDLSDWQAQHGAIAREAAPEIMRAYLAQEPAAGFQQRLAMIRARASAKVAARSHRRPVTVGAGMGADQVQVLSRRIPYEAFFQVEEWCLDHPRHDGDRSGPLARAVFQVCDAVTVLPYDPRRDRILLIEQFRVAPFAKGDPLPWHLEPVAGMIDAGESREACAVREAHEEAGLTLRVEDLHFISRYYPSPGGLAQVFHSYIGLCDLPDEAAVLAGEAAEGEDIRGHLVSLDQLLEMVESGEACNAPLIVSAQFLALRRGALEFTGGGA